MLRSFPGAAQRPAWNPWPQVWGYGFRIPLASLGPLNDRSGSESKLSVGDGKPLHSCPPAITRLRSEFLFDAQKLVVFRSAVGAGQRAGLDLPAIGRDREVRNCGVLGLARTVRDHATVSRLVGHFDRSERLGKRADLIDLDQDRVAEPTLDALGKTSDISDKQIVADQLAPRPDRVGQSFPAV